MIQEGSLQELAELVSKGAQILSLYLNVDPHHRSKEEYKLNLRRLLAQAAQQGALHADIERSERFFVHEYDRQGQGVACFSCQELGLWRAYALPVPVDDFVFVGSRPYITPLSDVWDAYGRFGVIMVDRSGARVFIYHLGALEDSAGTLGADVKRHKQGGWAAQKLQRYEDQEAKQNLKDAAEWADGYLREHKATRVVLSGSEDNLAQFQIAASRTARQGGRAHQPGHVHLPAQVWERVRSDARRSTAGRSRSLGPGDHGSPQGGAGALGLDNTLAAMQQVRGTSCSWIGIPPTGLSVLNLPGDGNPGSILVPLLQASCRSDDRHCEPGSAEGRGAD
jgi:hypothetical protein